MGNWRTGAGCLALIFILQIGSGGGFVLDGINLQLLPRGVRTAMEAMDLVFVRLYSRANGWHGQYLTPRDSPQKLHIIGWDPILPTLVLVHGFSESPDVGCVPVIMRAFRLSGRAVNVVVLDWRSLSAGPWYYTAHNNADYVATSTGKVIEFLISRGGAAPGNLHLVGCGLGARVAARAAANVTRNRGPIGRITGLDPWFGRTQRDRQLPTRVARFVDAIHTDAGVHGHSASVGHADFFPNGGISPQPGCELETVFRGNNMISTALCSHLRSYQYFGNSIVNPQAYMTTPCDSWANFQGGRCRFPRDVMPMGIATPPTARGKFYIDTRQARQYNRPAAATPSPLVRPVTSSPFTSTTALRVVPPPDLAPVRTPYNVVTMAPGESFSIKNYESKASQPKKYQVEVFKAEVVHQTTIGRAVNNTNNSKKEEKTKDAKLWSVPGVNTLSTFVRLNELSPKNEKL